MMLYLVRHGQSVGNEKLLFFGSTDYPLTPLGLEHAKQAAEKLRGIRFSRCVSSDLLRAWDTAAVCLEGRGITPEADARLREQDMGELENLDWDAANAVCGGALGDMLSDWTHHTPPGGESAIQLQQRASACVQEIIDRGEDTLLVAHNGSLSMLLHYFGLIEPDSPCKEEWSFRHGCFSAIEITERGARLVAFNE